MAELALEQGIYNQVCFHSQQCVEKALKGYIESTGKMHPYSHKSADILNYLSPNPFEDIVEKLLSLDRFYLPTRYPDVLPGMLPESLPDEKEAREALNLAKIVIKRVEDLIRE
jgi:HEPN domain-containing protein